MSVFVSPAGISADDSGVDIEEFNYSMGIVADALGELKTSLSMSDDEVKALTDIFNGVSSAFSAVGGFVGPITGSISFLKLIGLMKDATAEALANIQTQLADISNKLTQMDSKLNQLTEDMTKLQATEDFHTRAIMANQMSKEWHDFQANYMENSMDELMRQYNAMLTDSLKAWNSHILSGEAENGYQMDFYKVVLWYKCINPDPYETELKYELQQTIANDVDYEHNRLSSKDPYTIFRDDFGEGFDRFDKVLVLDERFFPQEGEISWNVNTFRKDLKEYISRKLYRYVGNPEVFPTMKPMNLDYYDFEENRSLYEEIAEEAANRIIYKICYNQMNKSSDFPTKVVKQFKEYCTHLINSSQGLDAMLKTIYLSHAFEYETAEDITNFLNQMAIETGTYGVFACNVVSMSQDIPEADKLMIAAKMSDALKKIRTLKESSVIGDGRYCYITNSIIDYGKLEMSSSVEDYWRHRGSYYAYRDCSGGNIAVKVMMSNGSEPVSGSLIGDSNALLLTYILQMNGQKLTHEYMNEHLSFQKMKDYNGLVTSLKSPATMTQDADIRLSTYNVIGDYFSGNPNIYLNSLPKDAELEYVNIKNMIAGTLYDPLKIRLQVDKPLLAIGVYGENHNLWVVDESALLYGPTDRGVLTKNITKVQTDSDIISNRYYTTTLTESITYNCLLAVTVYGQGLEMAEGGALSSFKQFVDEELPNSDLTHVHRWDDGTVTNEAGTKEPGTITYICQENPACTTSRRFVAYEFPSGDLKWYLDSNSSFKVKTNRLPANDTAMKHFEKILIDDIEVDPENYELLSGSVIVKLAPAYMRTLQPGEHDVQMVFDDGSVSKTFTVGSVKPKDGGYRLPLTGIE
ncbi:MAG: hypothetical protein IJI44_04580 [Erysipelotrichaceae bacterium]|nr:hypothetical protein [Erysipelotrichaceae bacterium]